MTEMTQNIQDDKKGIDKMVEQFFEKFNKECRPVYFKNYQGIEYLSIVENGNERTIRIISSEMDNLIVKIFRGFGFKWGANKNLVMRIKDEMLAQSIADDKKNEVHIRVAGNTNEVFIDLGISTKKLIKITPGQTPEIIQNSNFKFIRPAKQRDLPIPTFTKLDLNYFKSLFNFEVDDQNMLVLAYILKSLTPNSSPCPILILEGPQGSGKTTATEIIGKLIDPTEPSLFSPPKNEEDIKIHANSSWLLTYDNLSYLNGNLTDAFCRVSTGGGMSSRKLYSNDEELVYSIQRPVVFNGIEELGERPDFLDRSIVIHTKPISENSRKFSDIIWDPFNKGYSTLLGGGYLLLSEVLKLLPTIEAKELPRMADYAKFGIAMEKALELPEGSFMKTYNLHNSTKNSNLFDSDLTCFFLEYVMKRRDYGGQNYFIGTTSELMAYVDGFCKSTSIKRSTLPSNPRSFKGRLSRIKPILEENGIEMKDLPRTSNKRPFYFRWKDPKRSIGFEQDLHIYLNPDVSGIDWNVL